MADSDAEEPCVGSTRPMSAVLVIDDEPGMRHFLQKILSPHFALVETAEDAEAAEALRLTAQDLKQLGVIDRIIAEPVGGAQRDRAAAVSAVGAAICALLDELGGKSRKELVKDRRDKFLDMGSKGLAA